MAAVQAVRFYCEFCGSQVKAADRICPHCGSLFSQVRCQACGFQGDSKLFSKGCPVCGFSGPSQGGAKNVPQKRQSTSQGKIGKGKEFGYLLEETKKSASGRPPAWAWIALVLSLALVMVTAGFIISSVR